MLTQDINPEVITQLQYRPRILVKVRNLINILQRQSRAFFTEQSWSNGTNLQILSNQNRKLSQLHRQLEKEKRTTEIGEPPALKTRIRDYVDWVPKLDFINSYNIIKNPILPSKTKENVFQVLNRTLWTKNKAYKSGMSENPNCPFCEQTETMEHLLMDCDCYSNKIWTILSRIYFVFRFLRTSNRYGNTLRSSSSVSISFFLFA